MWPTPSLTTRPPPPTHSRVLINGTFHLFVTEMRYGCHLANWGTDSSVVHATSTTPEGPYTKVGGQQLRLLDQSDNNYGC